MSSACEFNRLYVVVIAHLGVNTIYSWSVSTMPSLTFFVCAGVAACSCLAALMVRKKDHSHHNLISGEEDGLLCNGSDAPQIVDEEVDTLSITQHDKKSTNSSSNISFYTKS